MAKGNSRSSQCFWNRPDNPGNVSKLIKSLDPVKTVTILSPDSVELPPISQSSKKTATLGELVNSKCSAAISLPKNETHDSFLILNGRLWMLLSPESFASFGLDGKKYSTRYLVIHDLESVGKRRERLDWALSNKILQRHEFIIFTSEHTKPDVNARVADILIPSMIPPSKDVEEDDGLFKEWANALTEWVGIACLTPQLLAQNNGGIDPAICDYIQPENAQVSPVAIARISNPGIRAGDVLNIWDQIQHAPWAVVHVLGFEKGPIGWSQNKPHEDGKEIGYTLIKNQDEISYLKHLS